MSDYDETRHPSAPFDFYHRGLISKLFPSNNMGLVRIESGREIPFSFDLVILLGEAKTPNDLKEGEEVGYDLGWTGNGLRVTKIKTFSQPPDPGESSDLKGQGGQGENLPS